ncbi:MAG: hypothetical protein JSU07_02880 [Bacteroidetes bacterium]|nr:hypothetical protein [Bacteroidota bacterium]
MKKIILSLLIILLTNISFSQTKTVSPNKVFASIEDYKINKPIDGISVYNVDKSGIELNKNGEKEKFKPSKFPYTYFTKENGMLMRIFDGDMYYVLVEGSLCYYIKIKEGQVSYSGPGTFYVNRYSPSDFVPTDYYSEGLNGEIKKLKDKDFETYLGKNGLAAQYEEDKTKREAKDSVDEYKMKLKNKTAKYFKLINEKMK